MGVCEGVGVHAGVCEGVVLCDCVGVQVGVFEGVREVEDVRDGTRE